MSVSNLNARAFYEAEAIRGGWSVRQLDRQIGTQFFERTSHSKQPEAMLARAGKPRPDEIPRPEDEIRDPYLLEFLNLKDEYGESDLEEALVRHLEWFLLELGSGFAGENDPVGIILCSGKDDAVVRYATGGIHAKVFAAKYLTELPDEESLRREIVATRPALVGRTATGRALAGE